MEFTNSYHHRRGNGTFWMLKVVIVLLSSIMLTDSAVSDSVIYNKKTNIEPEVPQIFPNDSNRYKIISNNSSLTEKFLYHSINMSNPEIIDMLNIQELKDNPRMSEIDRILKDPVEKRSDLNNRDNKIINHSSPNMESEMIQERGADVEKDSLISHNEHLGLVPHLVTDSRKGSTGRWIAMSAAIVLTMIATGYLSMLLWKRSLEKRYGSRQILVEEDEVREEYKHSMV